MSAGAAAAAAGAARARAIKATGAIVAVEPDDFVRLLQLQKGPLVITATGGLFNKNHRYLTSYKGLTFFTKSSNVLNLPVGSEVVLAKKIWVP